MASERFDSTFRLGDAITIVVKVKPFLDVSIPAGANNYLPVSCVNIAIFDSEIEENAIVQDVMKEVPNRPGYYFYRFQSTPDMKSGVYTAISEATVKLDGVFQKNRNVQEFRLVNDGVL